jgi:hypothetical protein
MRGAGGTGTDMTVEERRARLWTWILAVLLLALLVWVVGRTMSRHPRPEIGVSGEESAPARPTAPPAQERAERGPRLPDRPALAPTAGRAAAGGGGDSGSVPAVPAAPSPRR